MPELSHARAPAAGRFRMRVVLGAVIVLAPAAVAMSIARPGPGTVATEPPPSPPDVVALHRTLGLAGALDSLEAIVAADSSLLEQAHHWTHALAREAMRESGYDLALVAQCRPVFHSGCYHGTLEEYLGHGPAIRAGQVASLCANVGGGTPGGLECAHGVGHGLVAGLGHDLGAALRHCDEFTGAPAQWCYSGAFMENVVAAVQESDSAAMYGHTHGAQSGAAAATPAHQHLRADDAHYPCNVVDERYRHGCYMYQAFVLLRSSDFGVAAALAKCRTAPAGSVESCYEGMGSQLAGLYVQRRDAVHRFCALGDPALAGRCVAGAAEYFVDLDWSIGPGLEFCRTSTPATRAACHRRVGERVRMVYATDSERERACSAAPAGDGRGACRSGAGLGRTDAAAPQATRANSPASTGAGGLSPVSSVRPSAATRSASARSGTADSSYDGRHSGAASMATDTVAM